MTDALPRKSHGVCIQPLEPYFHLAILAEPISARGFIAPIWPSEKVVLALLIPLSRAQAAISVAVGHTHTRTNPRASPRITTGSWRGDIIYIMNSEGC